MSKKVTIEDMIEHAVTHGWITMYESLKLRRKSENERELEINFDKLLYDKVWNDTIKK